MRRNASVPLQTPEPHRKDLPLPVSSQYPTPYHLHPLTSPSRQPFSPSAISRPSLSSYPPIPPPPHPLISQPYPPTKPAHSRTDTPPPKRIGYKFPHHSMTDIPTHTHHMAYKPQSKPDISRLASYCFFSIVLCRSTESHTRRKDGECHSLVMCL